jgi:tRNA nucleotidyltransferase/poly(A) polymerase
MGRALAKAMAPNSKQARKAYLVTPGSLDSTFTVWAEDPIEKAWIDTFASRVASRHLGVADGHDIGMSADPLRPGGEDDEDEEDEKEKEKEDAEMAEVPMSQGHSELPGTMVEHLGSRVASRWVESSAHRKSILLMQFLSGVARKHGVGRHAYVVGGAVRNFLIDKPIKDIDVVIDSVAAGKDSEWFADQIAQAIPAPTNLTTNQYGVAILTVKGDWDLDGNNLKGEVIEIANARKESYGGVGGKGYKPSEVEPATIEEDVYRREFTFNTLLWRLMDLTHGPEKAEIIDLTGCGKRHLEEGVLECPADPDKVFSDDPTRILRAIKFTGKYGFKIPRDLAAAIKRNAPKMKGMPYEALMSILVDAILPEPTARKSLKQMKELGILDVLHDMVREQPSFASALARVLKRERRVQLLLDWMDLGLPAKTSLSFLNPGDRQRVREITIRMESGEAEKFMDALVKPPVNNGEIINVLKLEGRDRGRIMPLARKLIVEKPELAFHGSALTAHIIREWS